MAAVVGAEGLSEAEIIAACNAGARLVYFHYTVSVLVMTLRRSSAVHLIRKGEGTLARSLPYTLLTLVAGWWGVPFGPIYSVMSLFANLSGGTDVTDRHVVRSPRGPR